MHRLYPVVPPKSEKCLQQKLYGPRRPVGHTVQNRSSLRPLMPRCCHIAPAHDDPTPPVWSTLCGCVHEGCSTPSQHHGKHSRRRSWFVLTTVGPVWDTSDFSKLQACVRRGARRHRLGPRRGFGARSRCRAFPRDATGHLPASGRRSRKTRAPLSPRQQSERSP